MKKLAITSFALGMALTACGGGEEGGEYDPQLLQEYRTAIPSMDRLAASTPEATTFAAVGDPALYPNGSYDIAVGINGAVVGLIDGLGFIVNQEPTIYNSDTKEFLWGPYPNEDGFGTVAVYIREAEQGADFKFEYALARGVNNDVATFAPVIWGGATPNAANPDQGYGVTLWDFEANYAFEQANNPDAANLTLDRGRFVALYGSGAEAAGTFAFVVAVFRNFVPQDNPAAEPADLDYFYGRYDDGTNTVDFIDWAAAIDVDNDAARPAAENVSVRMAFLNEGTGRAEAAASGGDLQANQTADAVECWDTAINQTYLSFTVTTDGNPQTATDGDPANCGLFQASLTELGVPALADVDPTLKAALDYVAENGVPAE